MKLKIRNPKLVALLLANSIFLATTGCENTKYQERAKTVSKLAEWEDDNPKQKSDTKAKTKKVNHNICLKEGKVSIKKNPEKKSKVIKKIGVFQKAKEIGRMGNGWSIVKYDGIKGYIKTKKVKSEFKNIGKTYIEIDISDQKMKYYKNNKKVLSTAVVTGKNSTPTVTGIFNVYQKAYDYTMRGYDPITKVLEYESHSDYVLKFYKTYYIHDASWRSEFGDNLYKEDGSHGCVNTPYQKAKTLYNNVEVNTPVVIHK